MRIYNDNKQLILELEKERDLNDISYNFKVNSASKIFLKKINF